METIRVALDVRPIQMRDGSAQRGIGRYIRELAAGLRDHGEGLDLVLIRLGEPLPAELDDIPSVPVRARTYGDARRPLYLRLPKLRSNVRLYGSFFERMRRAQIAGFAAALDEVRPDLLHLPGGVDWGGSPTPPLSIPVVRSFLDAIPLRRRESYFDTWAPFLRDYYTAELARFPHAAAVVAISRSAAEEAREFAGVPEDRLSVVYPAVSPAFRDPIGPTPLGLEAGKYVLFCSVPDPQKNPRVAIKAFAQARLPAEIRLVFVAPERHAARRELERLANDLGVGDRFRWTGFVRDAEMPPLFRDALALISPSHEEGFGLPAAQALAAGTPVVASDRSALAEVVGDAGILANPDRSEEFAAGLARIHGDDALKRESAERGRTRAVAFSPEAQASALVSIYREAVSVARPNSATKS